MITRFYSALLLTTTIVSGSGCSWLFGDDGTFRDRSNDYRKAKVEAALTIPEGLDTETIGDSYAIPVISDQSSLSETFVLPRPESLSEEVDRDSVRINSLGKQRWILVDGPPGQVWPRLRGFLSLNQLAVLRADAVNGLIDTNWLQPEPEGALRERYRIRIEQGIQRGTSEVYVLHADLRAGLENWPQDSSESEREQLMIQELAQYLADSGAAASVSMLARQAIDSQGKITLQEDGAGNPLLKLTLEFGRAWASVGKALSKAGYTIDDLDRSQQTYYLHYLEAVAEDDEPGFFASLFSWGNDDEVTDKGIAYYVHVKEQSESNIAITITRQSGKAMHDGEAVRLLKLIKRHIS